MIEIRWHARAGQGAKTAAQLVALAGLRAGTSVQAFPEYGPERRGAPMRAYTRLDDRPIRRHCAIDEPDAVVVLEPSLLGPLVVDGLRETGLLLAATDRTPAEVAAVTGFGGRVLCVDAAALAGPRAVNVVMAGALAAALGRPPRDEVVAAAAELLGAKADTRAPALAGFDAIAKEAAWAA